MTSLTQLLVFSRFARQKTRLFFLFLAMIAASCLVVWTVGGYKALYTEAMKADDRPLGRYDVKIGAPASGFPGRGMMRGGGGGGGGGFGGPLTSRSASPTGNQKKGNKTGTLDSGMGGGARGPGMGGPGGPGKDSKSVAKRFDPLETARIGDGSIILTRLPESIPDHIRKRLIKADADENGVLSRIEEETLYPNSDDESDQKETSSLSDGKIGPDGPRDRAVTLSPEIITAIRQDATVQSVDSMRSIRAFVFAENSETVSFVADAVKKTHGDAIKTESDADYEETVPEGIAPDLHRRGLAAYRAGMGTPMSLDGSLTGIDAVTPPADLEEGRWFSSGDSVVMEAVLGRQAAENYHAKPNDRLLILTKTKEFQLTVVGILDDNHLRDFYVPMKTAEAITGGPEKIDSLGVVLTRSASPDEFKARWEARLAKEAGGSSKMTVQTVADVARQKEDEFKAASTFRLQATAGTGLAILASIMIIFTALSIGVEERRREIALARAVGLSRGQIAGSVLTESFLLAVPGWLGGLLAGWLILWMTTGKLLGLNGATVGFSFLCAVVGSLLAAMIPMAKACRVRPLEAVTQSREEPLERFFPSTRLALRWGYFLLGLGLIGFDLWLIYGMSSDVAHRAALHSGVGMIALVFGVLCLIPTLVRLAEAILLPILAVILCFDRTVSASELSNHMRRTVGVTAMLAVGGGLFVLMQVWGYSMLAPFLPNRQMPDAFAAFLPIGLTDENAAVIRTLPGVKGDEFETVAVEQAAFAPGSIPDERGGDFANVVFFGMNVDRSFSGPNPFVTLDFVSGDPSVALAAMKNGRGVVVNDSVQVDYGLKVGDTLRVMDPKKNSRILEYPIVGIVTFHGWQWLSKTSGVRRNYGRSGGVVFASDDLIRSDFHLKDAGYFWFNLDETADYDELEKSLDILARKNWSETVKEGEAAGNAAYVKLSTRRSLYDSISGRADSVIWGLSAMPLVTLVLMSVALVAVMVNSVRSRRRSFGILRSVGVERSKLVRMILAESILLGLVAAWASLLFGIPAAAGALKLGQSLFGTADPVMIFPVWGMTFGLGLLTALAVIAALIPALKIGSTPPLDLLQEGHGE